MISARRILIIAYIFLASFLFLIWRLADIQLISTESFSEHHINLIQESVNQRTHRFTINDGRGYFVDRNGQLLSTDVKPEIIVFPLLLKKEWPMESIAHIINLPANKVEQMIRNLQKPSILPLDQELTMEQMNEINELAVPGLYAQLVTRRKPAPFANHLIGGVGEDPDLIKKKYPEKLKKGTISIATKVGKNGLQYTFDPFLISEGETQFIYHVNRQGHPLFGLDVKYRSQGNPLYPLYVKTTIHKRMQETVEKVLDAHSIKDGGALLLDIRTNELLAMASRPIFDSDTIFEHENKMTVQQIPGSVFKIVTAAAAIEEGKVQKGKRYDCSLTIYGTPDERELGLLNFEQSFSQSCNRAFGDIANELVAENPRILEEYAGRLGLLQPNGWRGQVYHLDGFSHFYREEKGQVKSSKRKTSDYVSPIAIAQTAIGQLDVKVTPLSVANMMATIARGGRWMEVKAAESVHFANGTEMVHFRDHIGKVETLAPYTVMKLQSMLFDVVKDEMGTGHALDTLSFKVAGKSGTAEKDEESLHYNKWFAGYFPAEKPRFALVVLDLQHDKQNRTTSSFAEIAKEIMKIAQREEEG
jgi:penicillin-binding protein 4B